MVSVIVGAEEENLLLKLVDQSKKLVVELLVVVGKVLNKCLHSSGAVLID